jgi:hypothetical protein
MRTSIVIACVVTLIASVTLTGPLPPRADASTEQYRSTATALVLRTWLNNI